MMTTVYDLAEELYYAHEERSGGPVTPWMLAPTSVTTAFVQLAVNVLPLLADAWDEGFEAGEASRREYDIGRLRKSDDLSANPYRQYANWPYVKGEER